MSEINARTRHEILLMPGEARNMVAHVPLPPRHHLAAKFRLEVIGAAGRARSNLETGRIDHAWEETIQSLKDAKDALSIHLHGTDARRQP